MALFKKKKKHDDALASVIYATGTADLVEKMMKRHYLYPDKKKFNIDDYPGKYAMHCENPEELFRFYDYLHSVGRKWSNGSSYAKTRFATNYVRFNEGSHCFIKPSDVTVLEFKDFDWSDFNMKETKFKVGDKVRVKAWLVPGHRYSDTLFTRGMLEFCGKVGVILDVTIGGRFILDITGSLYYWGDEMLELVEVTPSFTKADLKPGMVVEVRDGARYLFVNEIFVSSGGYLQFISYNDDLTHATYDCLDVVKIFNTRGTEFGNILHDHHIDLIWEREEIKEMTVSEIEEKLGFKVKVIADKE